MDKQLAPSPIGKITAPVTKPQQDFNKLTEKIARLRGEIESTKSLGDHLEKRIAAEYDPAVRALYEAQIPLGRFGTMEEFAAFSMAFVDGSSGFTTGQFVGFAGGWV